MAWFQCFGDAVVDSEYTLYVEYNPTTKIIVVKFTRDNNIIFNDTRSVNVVNANYNKIILTGDPQYDNGSCLCIFNNFKIEQLV